MFVTMAYTKGLDRYGGSWEMVIVGEQEDERRLREFLGGRHEVAVF